MIEICVTYYDVLRHDCVEYSSAVQIRFLHVKDISA